MASASKPTVRDIARHAGVSVATVSRVTSDDPHVTPETRAKVLASIDALGYRPSALGRQLASGRFNTLGDVLPSLGGPYFAELIQGVESVAIDAGMAVNVLGTHLRPDAGQAVQQLAERTDGLIVVGGTVTDTMLRELADHGPVVLVADAADGIASVRTDGRGATRALTAHLLDTHGYDAMRFVGRAEGSPDITSRYAGFRDALAERGLTEAAPPLLHGMESKSGAVAARELVASGALPDALVCANDELAFGVLATLPGLGYAVPGDIAIVGFDDNALAALASPTLTTVHQPIHTMGAEAAHLVLESAARQEEVFTPTAPKDWVLETRLVIRESCGCVY
jgi:LacI family transcriptional regulator